MLVASTLLLTLAAAPPLPAEAELLESERLCVWVGSDGDARVVVGEVLLDQPPAQVVEALTDWDRLGELLPGTKSFEVKSKSADKAHVYRVQETPALFPDVWVEADATVVRDGDATRVRLLRRDGTPKRFRMDWEITGAPGGSLVNCRVEVQPPFSPPRFMMNRMQRSQLVGHVDRLLARLKSKSALPSPRCQASP
jgi:hypothetical protein